VSKSDVDKPPVEQLRSAFAAGKRAGFREGRESLYLEGWRKVKDWREIKEGDIVKLLVPSVFGWRGVGRVVFVTPSGVQMQKLDHPPSEYDGTCDACLHEILVLRREDEDGDGPH
jgi:hypothetical protein